MDEGEPEYTVSYRYYEQTGYFQKKYININSYNEGKIEPFGKQMFPGISSQTSQQLLQIADLIHIRFADVLLMQSELKQDATGLNKVRARSHLAPVAYSLEAIKNLHSSPSAGGTSFAGRVLHSKKPVTYSTNRPGSI